jgi:hypothetical protein
VASLLTALPYPELEEAARSRFWPSTPGTVVDTRAARRQREECVSSTTSKSGARTCTKHRTVVELVPVVSYDYRVGGELHGSSRWSVVVPDLHGIRAPIKEQAQAALADQPAGAPVPVYYDPKSPSRAVLRAGMTEGEKTAFDVARAETVLAGIVVPIAVPRVLLWLRERRRREQVGCA